MVHTLVITKAIAVTSVTQDIATGPPLRTVRMPSFIVISV